MKTKEYIVRAAQGSIVGSFLGASCVLFGISTAIHEYFGHGWLGGYLVRTYPAADPPAFFVRSFANLRRIFQTSSFKKGLQRTYQWGRTELLGGAAGWARVGHGTPNRLGRMLGNQGLRAWTSLAGSVPSCLLNGALITASSRTRKSRPRLAATLASFALFTQLEPVLYSWHGVVKCLRATAGKRVKWSHDFIGFAHHLSRMTGAAPSTVAITTATSMILWLPLVGLTAERLQN